MLRPKSSAFVCAVGSCIVLAAAATCVPRASAQTDLQKTSLALVPQQAAYYSVDWHLADQIQAVLDSSAVDKIKTSFVYQMAQAQLQGLWQSEAIPALAELKRILADPDNQALLELLKGAAGDELFVYGGPDTSQWLLVVSRLGQTMNRVQVEALRQGAEPDPQEVARALAEALEEFQGELEAPEVVVGGRLRDAAGLDRQLDRLETWLKTSLAAQEETKALVERVTREAWDQGELVVLRLEGRDLPWDKLQEQVGEGQRGTLEAARKLIEPLQVTLAAGQVHGYLVFSIGPDIDDLRNLGQGRTLLEHERLAPLRQHADKTLLTVTYVSEELSARIQEDSRRQIGQSTALMEAMIRQTGRVPERLESELQKDLQTFQKAWEQWLPESGAKLAFSYRIAMGLEGYRYRWGSELAEAPGPLAIAAHRGAHPVWFIASQATEPEEGREVLSWFVSRFDYYAREILKEENPEGLERYLAIRDRFAPLLNEMQTIFREQWVPAFNNQAAWVVDMQATSQQWLRELPPAEAPLPLPRPALVLGVDDRDMAREALRDLFDVVQRMWGELQSLAPEGQEIPLKTIPEPEVDERDAFTLFRYALPSEGPWDTSQMAPNAGLSDHAFVLSLFPDQTAELVAEQPGSLLPSDWEVEPNALTVNYFDWAGWIQAVEPWVDYGLGLWRSQSGGDQAGSQVQLVTSQLQILLDVLQAWKSYTSVSYTEDEAMVTRFRMQFQDVP